jgi:hypothetical protein
LEGAEGEVRRLLEAHRGCEFLVFEARMHGAPELVSIAPVASMKDGETSGASPSAYPLLAPTAPDRCA